MTVDGDAEAVDRARTIADFRASPLRLSLDADDTPCSVVTALFLDRFIKGGQPTSRATSIHPVKADATLLPAGADVVRDAREDNRRATMAEGDG